MLTDPTDPVIVISHENYLLDVLRIWRWNYPISFSYSFILLNYFLQKILWIPLSDKYALNFFLRLFISSLILQLSKNVRRSYSQDSNRCNIFTDRGYSITVYWKIKIIQSIMVILNMIFSGYFQRWQSLCWTQTHKKGL